MNNIYKEETGGKMFETSDETTGNTGAATTGAATTGVTITGATIILAETVNKSFS